MQSTARSLLYVGGFLSNSGGSRGVGEDLTDCLAAQGWSVIRTSSQRNRALRLSDMLITTWRFRRSYSVAQVEVYSGLAFLWAEAACYMLNRAGKPYVLTLHGGRLPQFALRHPHRVERLLQLAAAVTAPSRYLHDQLLWCRPDITVVPNALYLQRYEFRLRFKPSPRLVWLRAFHKIYQPAMAVRVLWRLRQLFPSASLLMIGPDKRDGSLAEVCALIQELGLQDAVHLAGPVSKKLVPGWLQRGDIFLNTSTVDNTPVSVMEAMACGLCVVSTNVGGLPAILEHRTHGLLTPADDAESMAASVRELIADPNLAAQVSLNGRRKMQEYDWSRILPLWQDILDNARTGTVHQSLEPVLSRIKDGLAG